MKHPLIKSLAALFVLASGFGTSFAASAVQVDDTPDSEQSSNQALTVVELFTSQGCSSCPPADSVLTSLADRPNILALSWPVDYWDRLGWEDTYGSALHTRRQRAYNRRIGRGGVYTPQLFVNATHQAVGSRRDEVNEALESVAAISNTPIIPNLTVDDGAIRIDFLEDALEDEMAAIRLVWFLSRADVTVGAGENRGRRLHYTNVVRKSEWSKDWKGSSMGFSVPVDSLKDVGADGLAVLVHAGYGDGPIIGASYISLQAADAPAAGR